MSHETLPGDHAPMFLEPPQLCPQMAENLTHPLPEEGAVEGTMLDRRRVMTLALWITSGCIDGLCIEGGWLAGRLCGSFAWLICWYSDVSIGQ